MFGAKTTYLKISYPCFEVSFINFSKWKKYIYLERESMHDLATLTLISNQLDQGHLITLDPVLLGYEMSYPRIVVYFIYFSCNLLISEETCFSYFDLLLIFFLSNK